MATPPPAKRTKIEEDSAEFPDDFYTSGDGPVDGKCILSFVAASYFNFIHFIC
jgi:hypothetical protein